LRQKPAVSSLAGLKDIYDGAQPPASVFPQGSEEGVMNRSVVTLLQIGQKLLNGSVYDQLV
jgi:hypothetical protein